MVVILLDPSNIINNLKTSICHKTALHLAAIEMGVVQILVEHNFVDLNFTHGRLALPCRYLGSEEITNTSIKQDVT